MELIGLILVIAIPLAIIDTIKINLSIDKLVKDHKLWRLANKKMLNSF